MDRWRWTMRSGGIVVSIGAAALVACGNGGSNGAPGGSDDSGGGGPDSGTHAADASHKDGGGTITPHDAGGHDAALPHDAGVDSPGTTGSDTDGGDAGSSGPLLGWYEGASCTCSSNAGGPGNIDAFATWLGSPITIGSDYAAVGPADAGAASWDNWEFPSWQSAGWKQWRMTHPGYRLVYAPGMGVVEDLAGGAAGNYDTYWKALGESLVAAGYPDAIIRIAHEFNGNWYWYQPQGKTAQFIGYWQHAVTAMRSASGQSFKFFWNPNLGVSTENGTPFDCENAYPGDSYVDYIGPDTYDADWGLYPTSGTATAAQQAMSWQTTLTQDHGLNRFVTFAAAHHKPLAIAEWGLWAIGSNYGGGDDPSYIQNMHDWLVTNHVAFANYFDSGDNQIYPGGAFPNALTKFKQTF